MKVNLKLILCVSVMMLLLVSWWASDIAIGYYEFKQACDSEGGFRGYSEVVKDSGWLAENESAAQEIASSFKAVPFARFYSNDSAWKDIRYKGGNPWWSSSYEKISANNNENVRYRYSVDVTAVPDAIRLRKEVIRLDDELSGSVVFQFTRFIFTWTEPHRSLLGVSGTVNCPLSKDGVSAINDYLNIKE